jgi:hypothetical protein
MLAMNTESTFVEFSSQKMSPKIYSQVGDKLNAITSNSQNSKFLHDQQEGVWKAVKT